MKKIITTFLASMVACAAVFAQSDMTPLAVVKYNKSETITLKQLKTRVAFVQKQYGMETFPVEQKQTLLENMINEKLLCQAAAKDGVAISDSQVDNAFLATFSQQVGRQLTEAEVENIIKETSGKTLDEYIKEMSGMSLSEYKAYLKSQLLVQNYVSQKKQEEIRAVAATDEEIRNAYEMNKSSFRWDEMMKLFLVMVPKGSNDMAAKALCEDMRNQYIKDPKKTTVFVNAPENGKSYQAGELLIAKTSQQAQALRWSEDKLRELFSRKEAYISESTETSTDFQFYVVLKKYDAKLLSLSDVVQPETTVTVYDYIKGNLSQQKQMQYFTTAAQNLAKELNTDANVDRKKKGDALTKLLNW
ncbi:peptidyl-prolyl cis-trans isomerase [Treponema sp.]|uniref:MOSP complex formation periplasmic protein, TDE1658 family n=1 Tax=Treponema sp. TaxID=166 RepID=UPI00389065E4